MSMNTFKAQKGTKVIFTGRGGWSGESDRALRFLTRGEIYKVERIDTYQAYTDVYLEGFGDESFNSVMFEDVFETKDGVEYGKIRELTNAEFTHFVMDEIESVTRFRELERVVITVDDHGINPEDIEEIEEIDLPTIVVDVKVRGALWTFWFSTGEEKYNYDIINDRRVNRYLAIKEGRQPEPPGMYSYHTDSEMV